MRQQIFATATGGALCHRYVTKAAAVAVALALALALALAPLLPITRNFALWALIQDSQYVVNYKK